MKNLILLSTVSILFSNLLSQNIWQPVSGLQDIEASELTSFNTQELIVSVINRGIYFSKDAGLTWTKNSSGLPKSNSYAINLESSADGYLYAIIDGGFYHMKKGDSEWVKNNYVFKGSNYKISVNPNGVIYILNFFPGNLLLMSSDHGETFTEIKLPSLMRSISDIMMNGADNNYLFGTGTNGDDIFVKCNDNGTIFKKIPNILEFNSKLAYFPTGILFVYSTDSVSKYDDNGIFIEKVKLPVNITINELKIDSKKAIHLFTNKGDFVSNDLGDHWELGSTKYGLVPYIIGNKKFLYFSDSSYILTSYCNGDEFLRTTNGAVSVQKVVSNWNNISIDRIEILHDGSLIGKHCLDYNIYHSKDKGKTWKRPDQKITVDYLHNFGSNKNDEWFTLINDTLYKSFDEGNRWQSTNMEFHSSQILSDNNELILLGGGGFNNYFSSDGGNNWIEVGANLPYMPDKLWQHPKGNIYIYSRPSELMVTKDNGVNWELIKLPFITTSNFFMDNKGSFFITGFKDRLNGLYVTNDEFTTFNFVENNLVKVFAQDHRGLMYGIDFRNIEVLDPTGKFISSMQSGLPENPQFLDLIIDHEDYLYVGISSDYIYRTAKPLNELGVFTNNPESNEPILSCNICKEQLIIEKNEAYTLPIIIYSAEGKILYKEKFNSQHAFINLSNYSNGIYFVRSQEGNFIRKFVVLH